MESTLNELNTEETFTNRVDSIIHPNEYKENTSNIPNSTYIEMVCQTVIGLDEIKDCITESQLKRKLPKNFAQNLIELENIIEIHHSKVNEDTIEKLAVLYKVELKF